MSGLNLCYLWNFVTGVTKSRVQSLGVIDIRGLKIAKFRRTEVLAVIDKTAR